MPMSKQHSLGPESDNKPSPPPSSLPSLQVRRDRHPLHRRWQQQHLRHRRQKEPEKQRSASDQREPTSIKRTEASFEDPSAINCDNAWYQSVPGSDVQGLRQLTVLMSLPFSSKISLSRRSSSASMPTAERTFLTSLAEGEPFPPIWRSR
jgi:hypothetical protein